MKVAYKIIKVLNNNSLLISNGENESIIIGKGIGFKQHVGAQVTTDILYDKEYHLLSDTDFQVQSEVPKQIIQNTAHIIDIVGDNIQKEIPEKSFKSLANHVAAMLVRLEHNEIFPNPFHHETVTLYGESYQIALNVAKQIEQSIDLVLPESEVDFLALYIHAIISSFDQKHAMFRNALISDVGDTLENELNIKLNKSSVFYARFVTHLKFLIERITRDEKIDSIPIVSAIAEQYPDYMEMSEVIIRVIEKHLKQELTKDEHIYLALHLARLTMKQEDFES